MKVLKYLAISAVVGSSLMLTGCRDDFSDLNTDPSQIAEAEVSYLFARSIVEFEPYGYLMYYYNAPMMQQWAQTGTATGGYTPNFVTTAPTGDQGDKYINVLKYVRAIEHAIESMNDDSALKNTGYLHCSKVLCAYLGILATDMYGDIPFTEACRAQYGGTITPKYDRQSDLYDLWLDEINAAIKAFNAPEGFVIVSKQDCAFNGDWTKWSKFANSLKLRIAARLINVDRERAKKIAAEVGAAPYIDSMDDALLFNKSISNSNSNQDCIYHWSNGFLDSQAANRDLMKYMVDNRDPRVRFCYQKNGYNSKVVQAFWNRGQEVPFYIQENIEFTESDGKKTFVKWKGAGEPWVRYYGIPNDMNAAQEVTKFGDYFDSPRFQTTDAKGGNLTSYTPYSKFCQQMIIGRYYNFKLPKAPGEPVTQTSDPRIWYGLYLGASEVNLYLAEFKLLGANLPKSAEEYYLKGVEMSVREYDKLAGLNKIAYYENTYGDYDPFEASIELKDGEISNMLAKEGYKLSGCTPDEQLEKVYIQQIINFTLYPNEQFVTARRSGIPKFDSKFFPRMNYANVPANGIPRRFDINRPNDTDIMAPFIMDALNNMGWDPTAPQAVGNGEKLNAQRVWTDINNPQFGEGPKK